ncbi:unnamed protein product, partial [Pneumocystis jirovecii]
ENEYLAGDKKAFFGKDFCVKTYILNSDSLSVLNRFFRSENSPKYMTSKNPNSFSVTFLAGAIAGISEILVMYPLDVVIHQVLFMGRLMVNKVKTRFQLSVGRSEYTGMMDCLISIVKKEGYS